eukprot:c672_g1_i1 orf=300-725(+)
MSTCRWHCCSSLSPSSGLVRICPRQLKTQPLLPLSWSPFGWPKTLDTWPSWSSTKAVRGPVPDGHPPLKMRSALDDPYGCSKKLVLCLHFGALLQPLQDPLMMAPFEFLPCMWTVGTHLARVTALYHYRMTSPEARICAAW